MCGVFGCTLAWLRTYEDVRADILFFKHFSKHFSSFSFLTHAWQRTSEDVGVYVCMYACTCMHACMHARMYVWMCMYVSTHVYTSLYTCSPLPPPHLATAGHAALETKNQGGAGAKAWVWRSSAPAAQVKQVREHSLFRTHFCRENIL